MRDRVRKRAKFACEYCGVTETNAGGLLTIDHIIPSSKGGLDTYENLAYCCYQCNQFKSDYLPEEPSDIPLWNPRIEPASAHFVEVADGILHSFTKVGEFSIKRLRLNRKALVEHRLEKRYTDEMATLLKQNEEIKQMIAVLQQQIEVLTVIRRDRQNEILVSLQFLLNEEERWH